MPSRGTIAVAVALAALVVWSAIERWQLLASSPFPLGVDGYFYPVQLRALLEDGTLAYPSAPLGLWLLAPLAAATDPITGAKLGAAIYGALIALPAYGLGARLGGGRGPGLLAAVLATRAAGSMYLSLEFVKNGIGLTVALAALWAVLRALERPRARGRRVLAIAGLAAAVLTHKMAAAIVLAVAIPAAIGAAAGRGALRGRRLLLAIAALAAAALALAVVGLAFPERFLSPADAALVDGLLAPAAWDAPLGPRRMTLGHEGAAALVLAVLAALALTRAGGRAIAETSAVVVPREYHAAAAPPAPAGGDAVARWAIVGLGLAIGLPWLDVADGQRLGFRLRIAAFVPMALAAAIAAGRITAHVRPRHAALAALAGALALRTPGDRAEGRVPTHPALVAAVQALPTRIPPGAVAIVPERHVAFMVAWYARVPSRLQPEPVPPARRVRVLPGAWIGLRSPLADALLAARTGPAPPVGVHPGDPNGLVVVPEATWQAIVARLPPGAPWAAWPTR